MKANRSRLIFAILFAAVFLAASCSKGERAAAMKKQIEEKVKNGISIGASRAEVESLVDSLVIESQKFTRYNYSYDVSQLANIAKLHEPTKIISPGVKGYLPVRMWKVDTDYRYLATIDINLEFCFDENERLVDYLIYQVAHP